MDKREAKRSLEKNFWQIAKFYLEMKCLLLGAAAVAAALSRAGKVQRLNEGLHFPPLTPSPRPSQASFVSFRSTFRNIILHLFAQRSHFFVFFHCFCSKNNQKKGKMKIENYVELQDGRRCTTFLLLSSGQVT